MINLFKKKFGISIYGCTFVYQLGRLCTCSTSTNLLHCSPRAVVAVVVNPSRLCHSQAFSFSLNKYK
jgi:hypothetical protein